MRPAAYGATLSQVIRTYFQTTTPAQFSAGQRPPFLDLPLFLNIGKPYMRLVVCTKAQELMQAETLICAALSSTR